MSDLSWLHAASPLVMAEAVLVPIAWLLTMRTGQSITDASVGMQTLLPGQNPS